MRETFQSVDGSFDNVGNVLNPRENNYLKPEMEMAKTKKSAFVQILEQPAPKGLRFRYECEGRSAGSIPGVNSSPDNKTFPTIQVVGYSGKAVVVVSCVTNDAPYKPHPHNLVGKEGCKKGVCTIHMNDDMTASFPNLGIQCVKKKDIDESLTLRQQIRVDPFQTGFAHKTSAQNIDLNCVRLAFQVFLEGNEKGAFTFALKPVVSDPIYDRKAKCDLTICRLTETSGPVAGGKEILLFCDKINKDDIQVRFFEEKNDMVLWEGFGDFQPSDVHKQYGICFRTPRYKDIEIEQPVQVQIQLRRPSDGAVSESRPFEFIPLDAGRAYWSAKRLKTNYSVFNQILTRDQAIRDHSSGGHGTQQPELKHKVPLSRAPVMAGLFTDNVEPGISTGVSTPPAQVRQTLRPVAMPGAVRTQAPDPEQSASAAAPQIPTRSQRPTSDMSLMSDFSSMTSMTGDNISLATTRQSVNEILSMADVSMFSGDTINLDTISVNTLLNTPLGLQPPPAGLTTTNIDIKIEPADQQQQQQQQQMTNSNSNLSTAATTLGSLTSVNTIKENHPATAATAVVQCPMDVTDITADNNLAMDNLDLDIGQIYDDVMQCVYDDVDIKYDDVEISMDQPPVPPTRRRETNIDADIVIPELDKPLPAAPRNNILTKLTEKKNELMTAREKEMEKKRREREELEEQKRKEREEKEKKKKEERDAKKREEDEKKAKLDEQKMKSSLFQRLFQRSQSRPSEMSEDDGDQETESSPDLRPDTLPPVPPHHQSYMSQVSMNARLSELEELISGDNNNSAVNENMDENILFSLQYPESSSSELNQSQPVQS